MGFVDHGIDSTAKRRGGSKSGIRPHNSKGGTTMKSMRITWFVLLASSLVGVIAFIGLRVNAINTASAAKPSPEGVIRERNDGTPRMSQADVSAMAAAYVGQPRARVTKVDMLLVTDHSNPLMELDRRPVWEVVVDGVDISIRNLGETNHRNKNIKRLSVMIDDKTGALLKVFSPKPQADGLRTLSTKSLYDYQGITMKPTTIKPKMSLLQIINSGMPWDMASGIIQAKELVAYYGLVTDDLNPKTGMKDVPCWVVLVGEIRQPFTSNGPAPFTGQPAPARKTHYGNEAFVVINANTGEFLSSHMTGPPQ